MGSHVGHVSGEVSGSRTHQDHPDWLIANRIAASRTFERAERLRAFLLFVTEKHLQGLDAEITEHSIGVAVFGRAQDYNPGDDSIVRSHARLLRQRLQTYYEEEGSGEARRVTIPKGAYVPVFQTAPGIELPQPQEAADDKPLVALSIPSTSPETTETGLPTSNPPAGRRRFLRLLPFGLTALAGGIAGSFFPRTSPPRPPLHPFWSLLFEPKRPTMFVAGDTGLVMLSGFLERPVSLDEYLNRTYRESLRDSPEVKAEIVNELSRRRYTAMIDMQLLARLQPLAWESQNFRVRYARDVQLQDLKESNVIICGAHEANPWTEVFRQRTNFHVIRAPGVKQLQLLNRQPRAGEQSLYHSETNSTGRKRYGHVAYLPDSGESSRVLLIEGTGSAGTEAASDFVLADGPFQRFLERIKRSDGTIPGFEVVLATDLIYEGKSTQGQIIAERVF
jgi:hypothetical protein